MRVDLNICLCIVYISLYPFELGLYFATGSYESWYFKISHFGRILCLTSKNIEYVCAENDCDLNDQQ